MKLSVTEKKNGMPKVVLTDNAGRTIRFDGPETDFNGPDCAFMGLVSFLQEKDFDAFIALEDAFGVDGLANLRGEREFFKEVPDAR